MKLLALNSSNKSSRENSNSEKPKEEEVNPFFYNVPQLSVVRIYIKKICKRNWPKFIKYKQAFFFFFKMALGAVHKWHQHFIESFQTPFPRLFRSVTLWLMDGWCDLWTVPWIFFLSLHSIRDNCVYITTLHYTYYNIPQLQSI